MLFAAAFSLLTKKRALMGLLVCASSSYMCYKDSTAGRTTSVIYNEDLSLHPLKVGGFKIGVKLPMMDGIIDNPLHSDSIWLTIFVTFGCVYHRYGPVLSLLCGKRLLIRIVLETIKEWIRGDKPGEESPKHLQRGHSCQ